MAPGGRGEHPSAPRKFLGAHQLKAGLNIDHASYDGLQTFLPVELIGASGYAIERITFTAPKSYNVTQSEIAWFGGDQWSPATRLTLDLGVRLTVDGDPRNACGATRGLHLSAHRRR